MTRVLVVDDSRFMRTIIDNALTSAGYEVETAENGLEAVDAVSTFDPAVVTMDVEMPEMDGIEAVERIMATDPTPILMLSAYTDAGTEATLEALARGAVDFLSKPDGSGARNVAHLADDVVEKVDALADADVSSLAVAQTASAAASVRSIRARQASTGSTASVGTETTVDSVADAPVRAGASAVPSDSRSDREADLEALADDLDIEPVVVVGASTGGPRVVERLLERLPTSLGATVIVVQHMPPEFTARFGDRLDAISDYDVSEADDGDRIGGGDAVVAPGGFHLEIATNVAGKLRLRLDDGDRVHGVRPSIDVTMKSVARRVSNPICGVALTGMGRDGAAGIEAIKAAGGRTIAQDEVTSPVFGIPCQAIRTGCVDDVVSGADVADAVVDAFTGESDD
ncbi:chemotaxis-specific protein-glutamate methyltransferase CheB [Natrarchaeobius oligotrophus]|uniref:Protein-glutamate methylesterase/protein-glutamine glutaminase n=1 Tax=Natrarchaeobius chitinivorans TaxID=1679083 RepID=A0A3N6MFH3_NATCH|nr:chemotaxis-specific protein-glutamate methyltransferase CheB [Natrarchaeobius chitinivorans]RQG99684.1 chemotaxis-specific protein-glutamate methyltransferase CheB [Natrarchaeobius chitinivorans]